jgi:GT2 family glycosyltransferase
LLEFLDDDASLCEIVAFSLSGATFSGRALQRIAAAFAEFPDADLVYSDVEIEDADRKPWPVALPAFDYERMLEQGYAAHLFAVRRSALGAMLKSGASNLYRLFNSALDRGDAAAKKIVHIPGPLGTLPRLPLDLASADLARATAEHLKARDLPAKVGKGSGTLFPAVRVSRALPRGSTTIVIPVRNNAPRLRACLKSIQRAAAAARAEIMIVDGDSSDPDMLDTLDQLDGGSALVLRASGHFNLSRLNNIAAGKAQSDYLCLLGSGIEAIDDRWLAELLSRIAEPDVGAVGALLLAPDRVVQHGGTVLGPGFAAAPAFGDRVESDPGYADALRAARESSAVSAACLLTRRADYLKAGGMDELRFPAGFGDVDYCLKLRAAGQRVIFTPHARLFHHDLTSSDHGIRNRSEAYERDLRMLRARWGDALMNDPYYNPMLSLDPLPFSALAWPPRSMTPRTNDAPVAFDVPSGL